MMMKILNKKGALYKLGKKRGLLMLLLLMFGVATIFGSSFISAGTGIDRTDIDVGNAIDTGLNTGLGIKLDLVANGMTHKVLEIDFGEANALSSEKLSMLITDVDFDIGSVRNKKLEVKKERDVEVEDKEVVCNPYTENHGNGSSSEISNCSVVVIGNHTVKEEYWEPVILEEKSVAGNEDFSGISAVTGQVFRYSFDVPIVERPDGTYGSTGKVYVGANAQTLVDLQHSSWWNDGWAYRKVLNITNNDADDDLIYSGGFGYTFNFSIDTASLYSNGKIMENCSDLRVICNDQEVDRVLGNETLFHSTNKGCLDTDTQVFFMHNFNISAGGTNNTGCYVYYGDPDSSPAPNNLSNVFIFYDDFNRVDLGRSWTNQSTRYGCYINNNKLAVDTNHDACYVNFSVNDIYLPKYRYGITVVQTVDASGIVQINLKNVTQNGDADDEGVLFQYSDESNWINLLGRESATTIKKASIVPLTTHEIDYEKVSLGDWVVYNGSTRPLKAKLNWAITNSTGPGDDSDFQHKVYVQLGYTTDYLDNIYLMRSVEDKPTITLGAEFLAEADGRNYIETGINNTLTSPIIYTDQQIYVRYLNGSQILGSFDKVAVYGNQRWAFNHITEGEDYTNMINLAPTFYVWENTSLSTLEIQNQVEALISSTLAS